MTSAGSSQERPDERLKLNLQNQLDRLLDQLSDLEACKDELDSLEYNETKEETMEQLEELNESLAKLTSGNVSLLTHLDAVRLATRAAVSRAFRTPEVIRLFAKREPHLLRQRLLQLERRDEKTKRLSADERDRQKAEILTALRQLGERLATQELQFLEQHNDVANVFRNVEFERVQE